MPPAAERWFEDYRPGAVHELGTFTLSAHEIVAFARDYDPQIMHVDAAQAAAGPFGGLIASGWHTVSRLMRLYVEQFLPTNGLAAPGIDELRWTRPVRPDDVLSVRVTIMEARRSTSKPDRGVVRPLVEAFNQHGELVLSMRPIQLVRCRPDSLAPTR